MKEDRQLVAIMFTDMVGYTAIMQKSEKQALKIREKHRKVFSALTNLYEGRLIQYFGDGTLSIFKSTVGAIECAIQIQEEFSKEPRIPLRIGIHVGDIILRKEEAIGDGVNIASRIEAIAVPGSILISGKTYDDIKNQPEIQAVFLGSVNFKNVTESIPIYAITNPGISRPSNIQGTGTEQPEEQLTERYGTSQPVSAGEIFPVFPIGREREVEAIHQFISQSQPGNSGILLISGMAGIGKSTLIRYSLSKSHYMVIESRAYEDITTAFGPIVQVVRTLLNGPLSRQWDQLTLVDHLGLLLPELHQEGITTDDVTLIAAIREVFLKAAEKNPVILLFEDIHWADNATLATLPKIIEPATDKPMIILASYRDESMPENHRLRWLKSELRRYPKFMEVNLKPLDKDDVSRLIRQNLQREITNGLTDRIFEKTQGLPLFVEEIIRTLVSADLLVSTEHGLAIRPDADIPIPDTISDTIALQRDGLSFQARESLDIAATIGIEFEFELLYEIEPDDQAIDELLQRQLIYEIRPGIGSFKHSLILNAIRNQTMWSRRRSLNLRVAEALEKRNASPEVIGEYWMRAGNKIKARVAYLNAARQYCQIYAYWDAAKLADKALVIWPEGEDERERLSALRQYADCMKISGQIGESITALNEILESPLLDGNYIELAPVYRNLSSSYALKAQWQPYRNSRESAARMHEKAGKWDEACLDWRELANHLTDSLHVEEAIHAAEAAIACAKKSEKKDLQIRAYSTKSYLLSMQGKTVEALKLANEALDLAKEGEYIEASAFAYRKLAGVHEYASNFNESLQVYDSALAFCRREDLSLQTLFCLSCMSWVLFRLGEWTRSLEVCREVLDDPETNDASRSTAFLVMSLIRAYRGEIKTAYKTLKKSRQLAGRLNFRMILLIIHWAEATLHEFEGNDEEAFEGYRAMLDFWKISDDKHDILGGLTAAVSFFGDHQQKEEVTRCVAINATIVEETGNPEAVGVMAFSLGISACLMKRFDESVTHLKKAQKYFTELEIPLQVIYTQYQLGRALMASHQNLEAVSFLKQAHMTARNLGLRPLTAKIESTLTELGEVPAERRSEQHATRKKVAGLTSRQYEILQALSRGLSNKEIAAKLFVSTRTVDMHVSNILDALNCRGRAEAVRIAMEQGII